MKFLVRRTSDYSNKPCDEAEFGKYDIIDIRTLNSPEEYDRILSKNNGTWYSKGENHCINDDGYIQRTFTGAGNGWFITINTLEELLEFKNKYGNIIIGECSSNRCIQGIEIYDDYRE